MPKQSMGEFMATLRKANGFTQQEVSDKLNISNRTLSSWETDRTLPDVLMLPAIADLYGVTVDELLRGERASAKENKSNDISESSLKSVYKNKYGAFVSKRALILGIAFICAAVFVLACALSLWTSAPAWLDWLLLILGIVGLCTCIAVVAYQYNNIKLSVGVVLDEDLTDDKKAFVTAMRHKLESFFAMCALPFALFAAITLIVFIAVNPQNGQILGVMFYVRNGYIFVICLNFALAAILLVTNLILKSITVKRFYSETQKSTATTNRKLAGKVAAFGCIPVAIVVLLNIVLALVFPDCNKTIYKNDDFDAFKTHLHTLVVDDYTDIPVYKDIPTGEYYLAFPDEKPEHFEEVYLGNGFYGVYNSGGYIYPSYEPIDEFWLVTYGKEPEHEIDEEYEPVPSWVLYVHDIDDTKYIVNARYQSEELVYDDLGNRLSLNAELLNGKHYVLARDLSDILENVAICTYTIVPICTIVTCVIIYAVKHKKQKYNF